MNTYVTACHKGDSINQSTCSSKNREELTKFSKNCKIMESDSTWVIPFNLKIMY